MNLKTSGQIPLPTPFFGCENQSCAEEGSLPAGELTFWEGGSVVEEGDAFFTPADGDCHPYYDPGWYCEYCLEAAGADINADCGPPLSECIEVRDVRERRQNES